MIFGIDGSYFRAKFCLKWFCVQVKSVLDPCEDENEDIQDYEMSLGADSVQKDDSSDSDSEVNRQCYSIFCVFISL